MGAANSFLVKSEWQSAPGVRLHEHEATWARIEILVGEENVTLVEDIDALSSRHAIYAPLYPIAEWIAFNWWVLRYNSRFSTPDFYLASQKERLYDRAKMRHNFRGIGDGFSWPDFSIIPGGGQTHLSWSRYSAPSLGCRIRYLNQGHALVDSTVVQAQLADIIERVIMRLEESGITGTALQKEWSVIEQADAEEVDFCKAAARLGLDPYSEGQEYAQEILLASSTLDQEIFNDFVEAVSPGKIELGLRWLGSALEQVKPTLSQSTAILLGSLPVIADKPSYDSNRPWISGWTQARAVRSAIGLDTGEAFSPDPFVDVAYLRSPDSRVQAAGRSSYGATAVALGSDHVTSNSRRFMQCRALWHSFVRREDLFLVTGAYTERQKTERAFAAELLAPANGIRDLLDLNGGDVSPDDDQIEQVAEHYGASPLLIQHQIRNQLVSA